jgi:hypothetical protein
VWSHVKVKHENMWLEFTHKLLGIGGTGASPTTRKSRCSVNKLRKPRRKIRELPTIKMRTPLRDLTILLMISHAPRRPWARHEE